MTTHRRADFGGSRTMPSPNHLIEQFGAPGRDDNGR
jgi:hypothetical protein